MLRFSIGSIPVEVRPSHLLIAGFLAWSWMPAARSPDSSQALIAILGGAFVVFVSILVHELGHAVVARMYGYRPHIVIEWFGGHTAPNATGPIPWLKDVALTIAGPLFGLALGIISLIALVMLGAQEPARLEGGAPLGIQILTFFAAANIIWAALNLIPVLPLDGGRISHAVFTRILGRKGVVASQGLALIISVAAVAWGASTGQLFIAVFFALWAVQAVRMLTAYFRGEDTGEEGSAPHPADLAFAQAATLFNDRKLPDARAIAERALQSDPPQASKTRLNHLLGWIAIKEGRGHDALEHFSQLGREEPEPQALAAAYSLTGDEERALPLWELAWRSTRRDEVKAEWAGTLLRLGRTDEARRAAGDHLLDAFRAAERILYLRGDFRAAARMGEQALLDFPKADVAYDVACSLARAGEVDSALRMLERSRELGFRDAAHAEGDPDLAAVRQSSAFDAWLRRVQQSAMP